MFGNDNLRPEFFTGLGSGLLSGNTWNEQLANASTGATTALTAAKQKADEQAAINKTVQMLQAKSPELANAVANKTLSATDAFKMYLDQQKAAQEAAKPQYQVINGKLINVNAPGGVPSVVGDYSEPKKPNLVNTGKGLLYNSDTGEWIKPPADVAQSDVEYNKTPIYGQDANGNIVLLQTSDQATAAQTKLPEGVTIGKDPIKIDTPTAVLIMDPVTRQIIQTIQKDIAGAEAQKVTGKTQGENLAALPDTIAKSEQALSVIDKAISHPGRETTTGLSGVLDPRAYIRGTNSADFQALAKQLEGKAFLEAFQSLKGGGQITEVEGQKATQAIARLSTAQSDEAYKQALLDLREVVASGLSRAKQKAGQTLAVPDAATDNSGINTTSSGVKWKVPGK